MKKILEICVDSLESARMAIKGGADRLELCSALAIGGLTPYTGLLRQIRAESDIEIRSMIRPRAGDFLYCEEELQLMAMQIAELKSLGSDGFVLGCLTPDGDLDQWALRPLMEAAEGTRMTLHRAIDVSRDLEDTYRRAAQLGFHTVLTSGGAGKCSDGQEMIGRLLQIREEIHGPEVLIGAGVSAQVISAFCEKFPDADAFHMSGKREVESGMQFRKKGVPMGVPGFDEWHIQQTDAEAVQAARRALDV